MTKEEFECGLYLPYINGRYKNPYEDKMGNKIGSVIKNKKGDNKTTNTKRIKA